MTGSHMLYLMRHGAPAVEGRLLGRTDDPVTEAGRAACVAVARDLDLDRIVASDRARAVDCAAAIGRICGQARGLARELAIERDRRWRELDFGAWDGLAPAAIDQTALARFYDDPENAPPPEGERWSSLQNRVREALVALPPVATLVVTHGGAIRAALSALCGFDRRQIWAFDLPYAALVSLRVWPGDERTVQIVGLAT